MTASTPFNLAKMTTGTTGTGTIALGSAVLPYLSFVAAGVVDGATVSYTILDGANSETGQGVYSAGAQTLTRGPRVSSASNAAIALSGNAIVMLTVAAEDLALQSLTGLNVLSAGVKNDGRSGWFYATWTNQTSALSIYALQATVTVSGATVSWTGTDVGRNFQPSDVGKYLAVAGITWAGLSRVKIARYISSNKVTTAVAADSTITAQANTKMIWPAFMAADAGLAIWIDRAATDNGGNLTYLGRNLAPKITTIATVSDPFTITVAALLGTAFYVTNQPGVADATPTRIEWGTDNTSTLLACGPIAVQAGWRNLIFPAGHYLALGMAPASGASDIPGSLETLGQLQWVGDGATGFFTDRNGAPIFKKIIPRDAGAPPAPMRGVNAAANFPRVKSVANPVVVSFGDSMGTAEPDLIQQGLAQSPERARINALVDQNGAKSFTFVDRSIGGATFYWADSIPTSFVDWYSNHSLTWESYAKIVNVGVGGATSNVTPDLVMLTQSGSNDGWTISPREIMSIINKIAAWPQTNSLPPDVMMVTGRPTGIIRNSGDAKFGDYAMFYLMQEYTAMLIWSMAKKQGIGCLNYHDAAMLAIYGHSSFRRSLTRIPDHAARSVTTTSPLQLAACCHDFKASLVLTGANGAAVWGSSQQVTIQLGARSDNIAVISTDGSGYLTVQVNTWGITTKATVSIASGANALTVAAGSSSTPTDVFCGGKGLFGCDSNIATIGTTLYGSGTVGSAVIQQGSGYSQVDGGYFRSMISDYYPGGLGFTPDTAPTSSFVVGGTVTVGGMPFVPSDATAQVDIVVGTNAPTKITAYTSVTAVTLRDNATVTYSAAANTPIFVGRICVPKASTAVQAGTDTGANPTLEICLTGNLLEIGYKRAADNQTVPVFRGTVERFGSIFYPTISVTGAALTIQPTAVYIDEPVLFKPTLTPLEAWGIPESALGFNEGGNGYVHNSFRQLVAVDFPLLNAQNLTAA